MSKCKTVTLRLRKVKNGTQYSLCLDYYPGYRDNITMKVITREALGIYIFAKPANQQERDFNARMMKKAEILRNRRYESIEGLDKERPARAAEYAVQEKRESRDL